jgi:hypothetical protein
MVNPFKASNKRTADDADISDLRQSIVSFTTPRDPNGAPQVVRRHHHRRTTVADSVFLAVPGTAPTQRHKFNVYKTILRHNNLFFQFAIRLESDILDDLLAIDKEFHYRFNQYSNSIVHDYACYHAKEAAYVFSPSVYPELCISDPMLRPMDNRPHLARDVPGIRWTKMVFSRNNVVREILTRLALEGHRVPEETSKSVMLFWITMDRKTNAWRRAFLQDRKIWGDRELMLFHLFLVKLDMRFSHPVLGNGACELAHLLLMQKSLVMLNEVLSGRLVLDYDDTTEFMIKTYDQSDLDVENNPWMEDEVENGVKEAEWGLLACEEWSGAEGYLESALDLLFKETARRGLCVQRYLLDFATYGYVDDETGANVPVPRMWRGQNATVVLPEEGWPSEDLRKGVIRRLDNMWGIEEVDAGAKQVDEDMVDA